LAHIDLIETSLRDGNQSLWGATGFNTAMMLEIAPILDQVGFGAIDFSTSTHMAVAVRFKKENPWERLRLMRKAMPRTPLQFLTTGMRFFVGTRAPGVHAAHISATYPQRHSPLCSHGFHE
jgi:oxaloacetate decarboxylase alpha subunit